MRRRQAAHREAKASGRVPNVFDGGLSLVAPFVTRVEDYAFFDCKALTSVSLPLATSVGEGAFHSCHAHLRQPAGRDEHRRQRLRRLQSSTSISLPAATSIGCLSLDFVSSHLRQPAGRDEHRNARLPQLKGRTLRHSA